MYPTISYFIEDLTGVYIPLPIQTFGFFVAMAFIFAAWTMTIELKRKEKEGILKVFIKEKIIGSKVKIHQLIGPLLFGFIIGFKLIEAIFFYDEFVSNPQEFILSKRGNFIGGLVISLIYLINKLREYKKQELDKPKKINISIHPHEIVSNIIIIAAVSGIIGAKIFHNLENIEVFLNDPIGQILSFSGLTFYGGFICGAIAVIWYAKKHNIHYKHIADSTAPGLMLAYGIGRMGCHFSGDGDWGIENLFEKPEWLSFLPEWMWAYNYPNNVINAGVPIEGCVGQFCHQLPIPVFPTPIYEIIMSFILFGFLWYLRKKINIPGMIFGIYLIVSGLERFLIEKIRVNTTYTLFGKEITQAEIISSIMVIIGIFIVYQLYSNNKKKQLSL